MGWPGSRPQRPGRNPGLLLFFGKCPVNSICLLSLKIHRSFPVHSNCVIQISMGSLSYYLSDDTSPMSVGFL
jgi:hypothetical protein